MLKDALNHPIRVGDTVLTGHHCSPTLTLITTVVKVGKSKVYIKLDRTIYERYYNRNTGKWETGSTEITKPLARYPYQMIVVNEQLAANRTNFPENFI